MRKISRVLLKTALGLGVAGIGLCIGGVAMGATITGFDLSRYGVNTTVNTTIKKVAKSAWTTGSDVWDEDWDEISRLEPTETDKDKEVFETDPSADLEFSLSAGELSFQPYDGDRIRIEVSGEKKDKVRVGKDDGSLVLETTGRTQDRKILVSYPQSYTFDETSIEIAAGTVTLEDGFNTGELDVSVAAGEFTNTGRLTAREVSIEVGAGNVELSELDTKELEADCGVGNIELNISGRETDYNYEISCAAGEVEIGGSSYSGIGHSKEITNPNAKGDMELNCGVGNITVTFTE